MPIEAGGHAACSTPDFSIASTDPFAELEPDGPLAGVVDRIDHIDRYSALVEDLGDLDVLDLKRRAAGVRHAGN
jgi:hypothetical protein